uniref:Uncharacterized protein n=1 Tax=Cannabis sativa TaxID=3483 RepID=A0A803QV09_CANSA
MGDVSETGCLASKHRRNHIWISVFNISTSLLNCSQRTCTCLSCSLRTRLISASFLAIIVDACSSSFLRNCVLEDSCSTRSVSPSS